MINIFLTFLVPSMSTIDVNYMLNLCFELKRADLLRSLQEKETMESNRKRRGIYIVEYPLHIDFHRSAIIFHTDYRFTGG